MIPFRELPLSPGFKPGDVLVVFGEVFSRGYVNGLIDEAKRRQMTVIYSTVGRRDEANRLRPLNSEELASKAEPLINLPLEAGFDMDPALDGTSPVDQLQGYRLSEWQDIRLDWSKVEESRQNGRSRFYSTCERYVSRLLELIPPDRNVLFAHTMAGGVPRAKIIMPVMNRVFKGYDDRYASSLEFWQSDLGRLCDMSFLEVTAETLQHLIVASQPLRERQMRQGKKVSYVAYGYHGTEIRIGDEYRWQSYSPYLQGFAKLKLEDIAKAAMGDGIAVSVFNAPEILTNSSSIFLGVEVALYPLLGALLFEGKDHPKTQRLVASCEALLKEGLNLNDVLSLTGSYFSSPLIGKDWSQYDQWPQHNGPEQMKKMRETSIQLIDMHRDPKELMTAELSELVFRSCGQVMLSEAFAIRQPVWWLGHDIVAKAALQTSL